MKSALVHHIIIGGIFVQTIWCVFVLGELCMHKGEIIIVNAKIIVTLLQKLLQGGGIYFC